MSHVLIISQLDDCFLPFGKLGKQLFQKDIVDEVVAAALCRQFVDYAARAVLVEFFIERKRVFIAVERIDYLLLIHAEKLRQMLYFRFFALVLNIIVDILMQFERKRFERSAHLYRAVVAYEPLYFSGDHRHGVSGKFDVILAVEIIDRLDKSHRAELHKILVFDMNVAVALDYALYQRRIFAYQSCFCVVITRFGKFDQFERLFVTEHRAHL